MLVLSRKNDKKVRLTLSDGRIIMVTVVAIRGDETRLGFEAPPDVSILREELAQKEQNHAAVGA